MLSSPSSSLSLSGSRFGGMQRMLTTLALLACLIRERGVLGYAFTTAPLRVFHEHKAAFQNRRMTVHGLLRSRQRCAFGTNSIVASVDIQLAVPVNIWCLTEGDTPPSFKVTMMCRELLENRRAGKEAKSVVDALGNAGVTLELPAGEKGTRCFQLPGGKPYTLVRETSFGEAGLGYSVWDAGIALSTWMALNPMPFLGRRVLELGSGVGIGGLSCAHIGASAVVLSDFGKIEEGQGKASANSVVNEELQPEQLMSNLKHNIQENGLVNKCEAVRIDWHQRSDSQEKFEAVIGSDVIYYEDDAEALAMTVIERTAPGGTFYLMNRRGRPGLNDLIRRLREAGDVQVTEYSLTNNMDSSQHVLAMYRAPRKGGSDDNGRGGGGGGRGGGGGDSPVPNNSPSTRDVREALRQREINRLRNVDPGGDNMATPW